MSRQILVAVKEAGADMVVSGSYVCKSDNYNERILELINRYMSEGHKFYSFNEDITYEDYKSSKFNIEYIVMISLVSLLFVILTLTQDIELFISLFPFFFIGLILTLVIFYIPIKVKYYRGIMKLLRREQNEEN